MGRIKRKVNPIWEKTVRVLLLCIGVMALVYVYSKIPYGVVKRNLTLQNTYTYSEYSDILEERKKYLTEQYYNRFTTVGSAMERVQYIKEHKECCSLVLLEIGKMYREKERTMVPYTAVYKVTYEDGVTPAQQVHIEGEQEVVRDGLLWWRVNENVVTHACTDLTEETEHMHEHE